MQRNRLSRHAGLSVLAILLLASCSGEVENTTATLADTSNLRNLAAEQVTLADYRRAEQSLAANTARLVQGNILAQYWQADDRLIYRRSSSAGSEYLIADLASGEKSALFDVGQLAAALAAFTDEELDDQDLDLSDLSLEDDRLQFAFEDDLFTLDLTDFDLSFLGEIQPHEYLSPDGSKAAYIDTHNLWLRDTQSNELTQLTFDGEENYGYATNNAGWIRDDGPVLLWSPDSSKIATFRHDGRDVGEM